MERAVDRVIDGYTEKHHIVPKCMGGDNKPRNLVSLTPEEHFLAHQLLVKIYPTNSDLVFALHMMTIGNSNVVRNNKKYAWLKRLHSKTQSNRRLGKGLSVVTKEKISKAMIGRCISKDTRIKISKIHKGKKLSEETKQKISSSKMGKPITPYIKNRFTKTINSKGNYVGVTKKGNRFRASITINGFSKFIGSYQTAIEASNAYQDFKLQHNL